MSSALPRYVLLSEAFPARAEGFSGQWQFVLQQLGGHERIEESGSEPNCGEDRLHLLSVVRGLEALGQPSSVALVTPSRYIDVGFRQGIPQWRENGWRWEHFDEMAPIKHLDLWQRIDRALTFHSIECRLWGVAGASQRRPAPTRTIQSAAVSHRVEREPRSASAWGHGMITRIKQFGRGLAYGYAANI